MSELTDFILARIAEDEACARAATSGPWEPVDHEVQRLSSLDVYLMIVGQGQDSMGDPEGGARTPGDAEHIARHDPARVLAECEAKRRIVALHPEILTICQGCGESYPCRTLHALALPYADHPDYRPEWRL